MVSLGWNRQILKYLRVSRSPGLLALTVIALIFWETPARAQAPLSASGGLTEVVKSPATKSLTYWVLPTCCGLLSLFVGGGLHGRRVAAGVKRYPERFDALFYWGNSLAAHVVLMTIPTAIFVYWRWFASPALQTAYAHYGSWAWIITLVWWVLPVLIAAALIHRGRR